MTETTTPQIAINDIGGTDDLMAAKIGRAHV